ncbi:hypothetical protein G7066_05170 [Leucobacter coleopterorum]|uniref:Uncharacterized protein n=1 Tax=Leucobacter coleopterorum TaxID=2714933 RepID=A0ABX6JZ35_9MICO|nr:hypothetical protein [Leucobacter coleopterorum]QIM18199.1 hypothetical protein G7066_05170 [Leucobacter coleopterorum]
MKGAPHTAAAKQLIDVILSKEAQEENLKQSFRRPVRDDIDPTEFVDFKKLEDLTIVDIHGPEDAKGRETFLSSWAKN